MMALPWQHTSSLSFMHDARAHFHDNIITNLNHQTGNGFSLNLKPSSCLNLLHVLAEKLKLENAHERTQTA